MRQILITIRREIHPFSIVTLILLDLIWTLPEMAAIGLGITIIFTPFLMASIFIVCLIAVALIQYFLFHDSWGPALLKGAALAVIATAPVSFVSLTLGAIWQILEIASGQKEIRYYGNLVKDWRDLEQTLRQQAKRFSYAPGPSNQDTIENVINFLYKIGQISFAEKDHLHGLRQARNQAFHENTPYDLGGLVNRVRMNRQIFRQRFGF
jgi:hypothetical protein